MIQKRLADAATDLYAMISTISRVDSMINEKSEDKCTVEIKLCNIFCDQAWRRIRRNLLMVDSNNDKDMSMISDYIVDEQKYPFDTK